MLLVTYKKILILKLISLTLWWILFIVQTYTTPPILSTNEASHIFILDLSHSMNIKDVVYDAWYLTRLETSKQFILQAIPNHNSIGIIWCNGDICSYLIPPTTDSSFIQQQLAYIHTNTLTRKQSDSTIDLDNTLITFLSDGSSWIFPSSLQQLLVANKSQLSIVAIGNTKQSVVVDPEENIIYSNDIRQTHWRNDTSLLTYTSSIQKIPKYSLDTQTYTPTTSKIQESETKNDIYTLLALLLIFLWL